MQESEQKLATCNDPLSFVSRATFNYKFVLYGALLWFQRYVPRLFILVAVQLMFHKFVPGLSLVAVFVSAHARYCIPLSLVRSFSFAALSKRHARKPITLWVVLFTLAKRRLVHLRLQGYLLVADLNPALVLCSFPVCAIFICWGPLAQKEIFDIVHSVMRKTRNRTK